MKLTRRSAAGKSAGGSTETPDASAPTVTKPAFGSLGKKEIRLVVGGESRVDLLPPEVALRSKARSTRRAMIVSVAAVTAVVAGGCLYASTAAAGSADQLKSAQSQSTALIQQQSDFVEVRQVQADLTGVTAATAIGASTEIDWTEYIDRVEETLPADAVFTAISVASATPIDPLPSMTEDSAGAGVATISLEATSAQVIDVRNWLVALAGLPGVTDVSPKSVTRQDDGSYAAAVVVTVDSSTYWNRFLPADTAPAGTAADADAAAAEGGN